MKQKKMQELLNEISYVLPQITNWRRETEKVKHVDARAFVGEYKDWKIVVVDFDIEEQGFPPGSRGYDGAATNPSKNIVIHLTRELAEKALNFALASLSNSCN